VQSRRRRAALLKLSVAVVILAAGIAEWHGWSAVPRGWRTFATATPRWRGSRQPRIRCPATIWRAQPGPFHGDDIMLGSALRMTVNPEASDASRLNAVMNVERAASPAEARGSMGIAERDVAEWRRRRGALLNTTFVSGNVEHLDVRRATLASVVWASQLTLQQRHVHECFVRGRWLLWHERNSSRLTCAG